MKYPALLFILLLTRFIAFSQAGDLDPTFGNNGIVTFDVNNTNDVIQSIVSQDDGKIVMTGYSTDKILLTRLNTDGSLDQSFGINGVVTTTFAFAANSFDLVLQTDGKIIAVGMAVENGYQVFVTIRYNSDGSLDTTFGGTGIVFTNILNFNSTALAVEVQDDSKIVVGGTSRNSPPDGSALALIRLETDGSLDNSFGTNGIAFTDVYPGSGLGALETLSDLSIQQNGNIVVAGFGGPDALLVEYDSNGNINTGFGTNGVISQNYSTFGNSGFGGLELQEDGKIIAVGSYTATNGFSDHLVARFLPNGAPDLSFGNSGLAIVPVISSGMDSASDVSIQQDGKIVVGGISANFVRRFAITRFDTTGNADLSFGSNGVVQTTLDPDENILYSITIQPNGAIVAAGAVTAFPYDIGVARYNPGTLTVPENPSLLTDISIKPNPTKDNIFVSFVPANLNEFKLELVDLQGRILVKDVIYPNQVGQNQEENIVLSEYPSGTYLLQIFNGNYTEQFKVIKL